MEVSVSSVQLQYAHGSLQQAIDSALAAANRSVENPSVEDLAPVDGFHIRGREATRELLNDLPLSEASTVLDIGCGIGGTARHLADEYGVRVVGVDLSEEYCDVARELTRRVQLVDRVTFRQGDALDVPVESGRFDLVVSEHVQMNVPDKKGYVEEIARVLRPGGHLALYEIFAGAKDECHFPVPWADGPSVSFLSTPDAFQATIEEAGLHGLRWTDCTEDAHAWFKKTIEKVNQEGPPPLGIHLLMGSGAKEKMKNVARNLEENRIVVATATARKGTS